MTVSDFILACARGINDPEMVVILPEEWKEILNIQAGEFFPEIAVVKKVTVQLGSTDPKRLQIDTSKPDFKGIESMKDFYLIDNNGSAIQYDDWVYKKDIQILDLNPLSISFSASRGIFARLDPTGFVTGIATFYTHLPEFKSDGEVIPLELPFLTLLKKICIREAARRALMDHTKLERFRTLVGNMNEYALMAIDRNFLTEIELTKRKLQNTNQVRSF